MKDRSKDVTKETVGERVDIQIAVNGEDNKPLSMDKYPRVWLVIGEDGKKYRAGLVRLVIEKSWDKRETYLLHMDAVTSAIQHGHKLNNYQPNV